MTHRQKVDLLIADLTQQGIGRSTIAPPVFRLLWALGFPVPPPLFLGKTALILVLGASGAVLWIVFGWLLWGVLGWLLPELGVQFSWVLAVLQAAGFGVLFGLFMARYYSGVAAKLRLPPWESYAEAGLAAAVDPNRKSGFHNEGETRGIER